MAQPLCLSIIVLTAGNFETKRGGEHVYIKSYIWIYKLIVFSWLPQKLNAYCRKLDMIYTRHCIPDNLHIMRLVMCICSTLNRIFHIHKSEFLSIAETNSPLIHVQTHPLSGSNLQLQRCHTPMATPCCPWLLSQIRSNKWVTPFCRVPGCYTTSVSPRCFPFLLWRKKNCLQ